MKISILSEYAKSLTQNQRITASSVIHAPSISSQKYVFDYVHAPHIDHVKIQHPDHEAWWFSCDQQTLVHDRKKIPLTNIESLLIKQLLLSDRRVCSKAELILCIHRDPAHYRGLEMCLSRLQEKFSTFSNGERLLRSVRNRGY